NIATSGQAWEHLRAFKRMWRDVVEDGISGVLRMEDQGSCPHDSPVTESWIHRGALLLRLLRLLAVLVRRFRRQRRKLQLAESENSWSFEEQRWHWYQMRQKVTSEAFDAWDEVSFFEDEDPLFQKQFAVAIAGAMSSSDWLATAKTPVILLEHGSVPKNVLTLWISRPARRKIQAIKWSADVETEKGRDGYWR
ncbi:unnamed protein product, partial [Cladocopium goreaui]